MNNDNSGPHHLLSEQRLFPILPYLYVRFAFFDSPFAHPILCSLIYSMIDTSCQYRFRVPIKRTMKQKTILSENLAFFRSKTIQLAKKTMPICISILLVLFIDFFFFMDIIQFVQLSVCLINDSVIIIHRS
jgi:hypothetical protein